tara:strand:- start:26 stop:226 length:201 start_codon:yes stop_codon:yes gene_type:complete
MNCWHCNKELIWGGDHDIEEENEEYDMVTNLSCPKCKSFFLVYKPRKTEDFNEQLGKEIYSGKFLK